MFIYLEDSSAKPTLSMYLLQNLQGNLSVVQSFIFCLKISSDFAFLISQGTMSHILGQGKICFLSQSTLWSFFAFAELNYLSDCMASVQNIQFQVLNHFSLYKFLSLRFADFFGEYLLICQQIIQREICFIFVDKY